MEQRVNCKLDTVRERDMDLLLMGAFMSDEGFAKLFADKIGIEGSIEVLNVELSRVDAQLGESDVTVILEADGVKRAFLIEDKVDAIAMPNQHERYVKRGEKSVAEGEYSDFDIFIFCPKKYYDLNQEAKLYENVVTYEEALEYFDNNTSSISKVWSEVISQAIDKAKKPAEINLNESANAFTVDYKNYLREYYPDIDIRTKDNANGYWLHIGTLFSDAYIYHKIPQGYVDLTIPNRADMADKTKHMAKWLRDMTDKNITSEVTGKAVAFRIAVPVLDMEKPFGYAPMEDIKECSEAIKTLVELAEFMENASKVRK